MFWRQFPEHCIIKELFGVPLELGLGASKHNLLIIDYMCRKRSLLHIFPIDENSFRVPFIL